MSEERFVIEDNIPIPSRRGSKGRNAGLTAVLRSMEVGQSVLVPKTKPHTVSGFFQFLRRTTDYKFTYRKQGDDVRVWRVS